MALKKKVECDGFSYIEEIDQLTPDLVDEAKSSFLEYQSRGVIISGTYEDDKWYLSNEVVKTSISFSLDEFSCIRSCQKLGCTIQDCRDSLRVYALSQFGYALYTISARIHTIISFLGDLSLPDDPAPRSTIEEFLELLPGWSIERDEIFDLIYYVPDSNRSSYKRRELKRYQSYFKFDHFLTKYWLDATNHEKLLFFPIWLWWNLTAIIPLRVTEFTLIPRDCIREKNGGYYIRLRRTKLKSKNGSAQYKIAEDYEVCEYSIPANMYFSILSYQHETNQDYLSDIGTLFSRPTQAKYTNTRLSNDYHYTYTDLRHLLNVFYSQVLSEKYHLVLASEKSSELSIEEIEKINLGDTRHIANISLMVSGNSALIVKELSRHSDINIGSNYYGSVKSFLDALSFESYTPSSAISSQEILSVPSDGDFLDHYQKFEQVTGGRCMSAQFKNGDFSVCSQVLGSSGQIGDCSSCIYFASDNEPIDGMIKKAEQKLQMSCDLLVQTIEAIRRGDNHEPLQSIIERLQSNQLQYLTATSVERRYKEEVGYEQN